MADDVLDILDELYKKQQSINSEIRKKRIEIAKKTGDIVESIDDLTCQKHPGEIFEITETILDSTFFGKEGQEGLNIYQCRTCREDRQIFKKTTAYDCPVCGIVTGDFTREDYCSSKESWANLAGREGEHYHCRVCNLQLGEYYWKMS